MAEHPSGMGGPVIDPTKNVLDKVEDAVKRLDDLRVASERLANVKHNHLKEIGEIRGAHIKEMMELRAAHARELNAKETSRLDAIRDVDMGAAAIREERVTASAAILASQVATSAEALRSLVATTAGATGAATATQFQQQTDRIAVLEKGSYGAAGRSEFQDPMMAKMAETMESIRISIATGQGQQVGHKESRTEQRADYGLYIAIVAAVIASGLLPRLLS